MPRIKGLRRNWHGLPLPARNSLLVPSGSCRNVCELRERNEINRLKCDSSTRLVNANVGILDPKQMNWIDPKLLLFRQRCTVFERRAVYVVL